MFRPLVAALILFATASAAAFGLDDVGARASSLAARPTRRPRRQLPTQLRELDYDAYRDIRYRPEKALWRAEKLPFELMFFHQGRTVPEPVRINVIEPSGERAVAFDPALFDYGKNKFEPQTLSGVGFNGFRVHYPINKPGYKDEVVVFQGASYFRALGKGQSYGLSARGLAVDTAAPRRARSSRASSSSGSSARAPTRDLADDLRAARLAPRRRRLPLRR